MPTCSISGLEASLLHWVVWEKTQKHLVAAGDDRRGFFGATEASESWDAHVSPVVDLQMVVSTLQMSLHVDLVENLRDIWMNPWLLYHEIMFHWGEGTYKFDTMTRCGGQNPGAGLLARVSVRPVGAAYCPWDAVDNVITARWKTEQQSRTMTSSSLRGHIISSSSQCKCPLGKFPLNRHPSRMNRTKANESLHFFNTLGISEHPTKKHQH